jgi:hypothetical protein
VDTNEVEVYVTLNGRGRAAIVRRPDGFLCIYKWWKLTQDFLPERFVPSQYPTWTDDPTPPAVLYDEYTEPLIGIHGTVDDARRELRSLPGFEDAALLSSG